MKNVSNKFLLCLKCKNESLIQVIDFKVMGESINIFLNYIGKSISLSNLLRVFCVIYKVFFRRTIR